MVIKTANTKIKDEILNWLAPLGVVSSIKFCDIAPQATDRNADYSARLDPVYMYHSWVISINWDDKDDQKLLFLLKFGEYV